ncbi:MAG TPA: phosphomethylpyrimidine synthase ThiC [Synergistaceae bacterium]|nr:phosphomethylpyrimidine synthase ThiC [Synergistaceae bacterium]
MATLINALHRGEIPEYFSTLGKFEEISPSLLAKEVLQGRIVIPWNNRRKGPFTPVAVGKNMRVKINANVGTSPERLDFSDEMEKIRQAISLGADALMDLSIPGPSGDFRRQIVEECGVPLGTVPLYQAAGKGASPEDFSFSDFLEVFLAQAEEGVDFMTIHAGLLQKHLPLAEKRLLGVVSRGGSLLVSWMRRHHKENFLYENFDALLEIAREYDITLSLGDGLRPGCTADANDEAQFGELQILGELVTRCREAGVQVMVEGPGHVPLHLIEENVRIQKELCSEAPFYVLGPLVVDCAAGHDHMAGAIGGALAAHYGADFLCYLTPAEHLRLPSLEDVRQGVIATKIAAAAADLSRGKTYAIHQNDAISRGRRDFDWNEQKRHALDPRKFSDFLETVSLSSSKKKPCSMCGEWCALKGFQKE